MKKDLLATIAAAALLAAGVFVNLPANGPGAPAASAPSATDERTPTTTPPPTTTTGGPIGVPDRLVVAALDIDAPVTPVGTTPENAQEVPAALDVTGWWRDGSVPGAPGNAVVVGHTASSDDGVFDPLVDVEAGDEVLVSGEDGTIAFVVERRDIVPVDEFSTVAADVYRATGDSGLVLMTCGDWNGRAFETTVIVHAAAVPASA